MCQSSQSVALSVTSEIGDISYFVTANGDVSKEIIIKLRKIYRFLKYVV